MRTVVVVVNGTNHKPFVLAVMTGSVMGLIALPLPGKSVCIAWVVVVVVVVVVGPIMIIQPF